MKSLRLLLVCCWVLGFSGTLSAQCSSLYTTPEFPIATHPADGHTQSWGANLFMAAQMGAAASFTGIQIYVDNSFGPTTYANQQIWLRNTAVTGYPNAQYPTTAGFTQCFTGTYNFPMSGLYTIAFNVSPFAHNGTGNVEILFENRSNVYRANEPWFRRTPTYGAGVYRSKWNGNFGFGGFPGTASNGSAVRLTYTLSLTAAGGGGCGVVLPVSFPSFSAGPEGQSVRCSWDLDVAPNENIVLERSAGDANFQPLTTVEPGQTGHFDWVDSQPNPGVNLYRLRGRDANGNEMLSSMVLVDMKDRHKTKLYVNASAEGLDLVVDSPDKQNAAMEICDLQGRRVHTMDLDLQSGRNHVTVPLDVAHGIWVVQVCVAGETLVAKVVR
ncbi:MAG: hypothetical protein RLZZ519_2440 [Bacteroidota bacterium]|jgi:hypothetical protein